MQQSVNRLTQLPNEHLVQLAGPEQPRVAAESLTAVDSVDQLRHCEPGSLVIVPRHWAQTLTGFELDTMVRYASDRGVAGFVFVGLSQIPVTIRRLAAESGISVFGFLGTGSIVDLVRRLDGLMGQGHAAVIERATAAFAIIRSLSRQDDYQQIIDRVSEHLGSPIRLTWFEQPTVGGEPVIVANYQCGWLENQGAGDPAIALVLPALASAVGQSYQRSLNRREETGEVLTSLLTAPRSVRDAIAQQARSIGVNLDTKHLVACITREENVDPNHFSPNESRKAQIVATIVADGIQRNSARDWTVIRISGDLNLVWSTQNSTGLEVSVAIEDLEMFLKALAADTSEHSYFCGLGLPAHGVDGLLASATQARGAANYARKQRINGRVVQSDTSRLGGLLADFLGSPLAMHSIHSMLAPFNKLSETARHNSIITLSTYLDFQGSNQRAAERLHLHPNAVGYRIKKTLSLLGTDLSDPDERIAVHLACRIWLLEQANVRQEPN